MSLCNHCGGIATWFEDKMVSPTSSGAPHPHDDIPTEIKADYEEARSVLQDSPRSAAALLRLSLQKLCKALGEKGDNINDDIASLVEKG